MADVTVQKRGEVYQYKFEIASIDGKRKFKNKSGFATKSEAKQAGIIAYNEYLNTGHSFKPKTMSYSDYLDYWMKEHCEINLKYHTAWHCYMYDYIIQHYSCEFCRIMRKAIFLPLNVIFFTFV